MTRLPRTSGKQLVRALQRAGFEVTHIRGSHHYLRRPGSGPIVPVPVHGNRGLPDGTTRSILRLAGLSPDNSRACFVTERALRTITTVDEMTAARAAMSGVVGVVPTMGYLHEGHLSLVRAARAECEHVIATIFVNPTQFGPKEDFERYPRDEERDLALLGAEGVDAVFIPPVDEIYPPGFSDWIEVSGPLTERLEGAHRPGHFRGVTTVVARLFRIIRPHRAYFGQKDGQQLRVVRRMVEEQGLGVEVIAMPIVREPDGLAMSSRNVYLSPEERKAALVLSRSLRDAAAMVRAGEVSAEVLRGHIRGETAHEPLVELDYVSVADEGTLKEMDTVDRPAMVLLAARVGTTRLIDNVVVVPPGSAVPPALGRLV